MKIKLNIRKERHDEVENFLTERGIEIGDDADFLLSEIADYSDVLIVKDKDTNEQIVLPADSIIYIESYGHSVEVHTQNKVYLSGERLYKIMQMLDPEKYLRISNSVVIAKKHVRKINPTFSMKFILTLSDNSRVDVTRSYYYIFKEYFNI